MSIGPEQRRTGTMRKSIPNVRKVPLKIVSIYAIFSILWLWFSDRALSWLEHPDEILGFAFGKGVFFVFLTSVALYALLSQALSKLAATQGELQRSEDRLRSLFEHMQDGLADCKLLYDASGQACDYVYLDVNPSYYLLTQQVDVKNKKASQIYPGIQQLNPELIQLFARVVQSGMPETVELFFQPRQCWINFSVFRPGPEGDEFAVIFQDTTEKRRRDQQEQERLAVDAANEMKNEFVANVSHEIRTPLNAILGLTYLALQGEKEERQRDYLEKIHKAGQGLLALVNDVLDFSKVAEGQLTLESTRFQLDEVLENVSTALAQTAFDKGLDFVISVDPKIPMWIQGDSLRLGQILINLVSNAVKFTEKGKVAMEITLSPDTLSFAVHDSGIGISEAQRKALFVAFTQGDASITRKYGGTGLGLAISQRLAHLMGGVIESESQPGVGSIFCLKLPSPFTEPEMDPHPDESPVALNSARVLLVDDDPQSVRVLQQLLHRIRATVTVVSSAQVSRHEGTGYDYALIQQGAQLGLEITQRLSERARRLILIVKPGSDTLPPKTFGVDGYLVKPVLLPRLRDALLGSRQAASATSYRVFESARILVAEDHPVNQQVIQELLERAGLTVEVANDGRQALDMLLATEPCPFQAVLMDLQMPVLDGYEATRRIRQFAPLATLPILALSAHVLPEERQRCQEVGMNDYLTKPIDPESLVEKLAQWLPASIRAAEAPPPPGGPPTGSVNLEEVAQVIKTLEQQMSNFEGAAIDSVDTLATLLRPLGPQPALAELRKEIERFEFDHGRIALQRLCEQLKLEDL